MAIWQRGRRVLEPAASRALAGRELPRKTKNKRGTLDRKKKGRKKEAAGGIITSLNPAFIAAAAESRGLAWRRRRMASCATNLALKRKGQVVIGGRLIETNRGEGPRFPRH